MGDETTRIITLSDNERPPKIERRGNAKLQFKQKTDGRKARIPHTGSDFFLHFPFLLFQNQTIRVGCLGVLNLYFTGLILVFPMFISGSL